VPLDKSEGSVKGIVILGGVQAPLGLPEKVEDQDSGNLTLNHFAVELGPPTIDSGGWPTFSAAESSSELEVGAPSLRSLQGRGFSWRRRCA